MKCKLCDREVMSSDLLYCNVHVPVCIANNENLTNRCFNIAIGAYTENASENQMHYCWLHDYTHNTDYPQH